MESLAESLASDCQISGKKVVRLLCGLRVQSCLSGSHIIFRHEDCPTLTIPNHRELAPGLLRSVIRQADLGVHEFINALS